MMTEKIAHLRALLLDDGWDVERDGREVHGEGRTDADALTACAALAAVEPRVDVTAITHDFRPGAQDGMPRLADVEAGETRVIGTCLNPICSQDMGHGGECDEDGPFRRPCNVDHTTDERPRVTGGECAECLHRPPLHEPTCTKARCSHTVPLTVQRLTRAEH